MLLVESTLIALSIIFFKIAHFNIIHLYFDYSNHMNDIYSSKMAIFHLYR